MGKLNMSRISQKAEDLKRSGGYDADFDKLEPGKNLRRILPPKGDKDVFWSEGYLHFNVGPEGKQTVTCLDTVGNGRECPICQYVEKLKQSRKSEDKKLATELRKVKRMYIAVINRDKEDDTPLVLPVGKTILQPIIDFICDPDYGDITDFNKGHDITIIKTGQKLQTEYRVVVKPKSSIASTEYTEEQLDDLLPDLDAVFVQRSAEELQAILEGEDYEEDDENEDEGAEGDYDDMSLKELSKLCKERGLGGRVPAKASKLDLISLLESYDLGELDEEDEDEDEDEEDVDDLQRDIEKAVKRYGKKK